MVLHGMVYVEPVCVREREFLGDVFLGTAVVDGVDVFKYEHEVLMLMMIIQCLCLADPL